MDKIQLTGNQLISSILEIPNLKMFQHVTNIPSGRLDSHQLYEQTFQSPKPDWIRPKILLTNKVRQIHHDFP